MSSITTTSSSSSTPGSSSTSQPLPVTTSPSTVTQTTSTTSATSSQSIIKPILPPRNRCMYTPFYCEENVWNLCQEIKKSFPEELQHCYACFVSNLTRIVPMWRQRMGLNEDKLANWDYHIILLYNPDERCVVYDMDSDLPFPTYFHRYVSETFRTESILQPEHYRYFRIAPAPVFLELFSSNRKHMIRDDGTYIHPPPSYQPIINHKIYGRNTLEDFLDMNRENRVTEYGELLNFKEFIKRFYKPRQLQ